jgi:carbon storage regulator
MLVLSRRTNETLVIDNNIRFTVLSVHGNQVRIGIEAPDDIIVLREEIIHHGGRPRSGGGTDSASLPVAQPDPYQARSSSDARAAGDTCRRPESSSDYNRGNEHGKRRGVLGLRRRRPS